MSDIDTGVVVSLKVLDPDGRLEKRTSRAGVPQPDITKALNNLDAAYCRLHRWTLGEGSLPREWVSRVVISPGPLIRSTGRGGSWSVWLLPFTLPI